MRRIPSVAPDRIDKTCGLRCAIVSMALWIAALMPPMVKLRPISTVSRRGVAPARQRDEAARKSFGGQRGSAARISQRAAAVG